MHMSASTLAILASACLPVHFEFHSTHPALAGCYPFTDFQTSEFACRHCGEIVIHPALKLALQSLRDELRRPITITSGYRCRYYNRLVGGTPASYHMEGKAADIVVKGMSATELYHAAMKIPAFRDGGIGVYRSQNFIHLDVRAKRYHWGYPRNNRQP